MDDLGIIGGPAALRPLLARPDLAPLAAGRDVAFVPGLAVAFRCPGQGRVEIGPGALDPSACPAVALRHALELALQLDMSLRDPVLAGLIAARVAALFAALERSADTPCLDEDGLALLAADAMLPAAALAALWTLLARHQVNAPAAIAPATLERLAAVWALLGPAEHVMGLGGDTRLRLDPATGLNVYGSSARPRPWAVTFASSTASSVSERGYDGAEQARRRMLGDALARGVPAAQRRAAARIRQGLRDHYGLGRDIAIVLTPSGTDGELCALAVALLGEPGRPMTNILIAPEETGSGVPLAATGRHFAAQTARGVGVTKGELIAGFPADIDLKSVAIRAPDGRIRGDDAIHGDSAAKAADAVASGRRVLLHLLDVSKTGLVAPLAVDDIVGRHGGAIDVVVDACQARLSAAAVRDYVDRGFMVLLTGSKFFTGPPFAGALLLPESFARRLAGPRALPAGLGDYFGRWDWPEQAHACRDLPPDGNVGLAHRWAAALAEMAAFAAVGEAEAAAVLRHFGDSMRRAIAANPDLVLQDTPAPSRRTRPYGWDTLPTIFAFALLDDGASGRRRPLDPAMARQVYDYLNSDVAMALPRDATRAERALASLRCHLGQPVALVAADGAKIGALRLCAGARLVSGEPSRAALEGAARLASEIADACAALEKISLILRHFAAIRAADPRPTYR